MGRPPAGDAGVPASSWLGTVGRPLCRGAHLERWGYGGVPGPRRGVPCAGGRPRGRLPCHVCSRPAQPALCLRGVACAAAGAACGERVCRRTPAAAGALRKWRWLHGKRLGRPRAFCAAGVPTAGCRLQLRGALSYLLKHPTVLCVNLGLMFLVSCAWVHSDGRLSIDCPRTLGRRPTACSATCLFEFLANVRCICCTPCADRERVWD